MMNYSESCDEDLTVDSTETCFKQEECFQRAYVENLKLM